MHNINQEIHPDRALKLKELKDSGKITMMFYEMLDYFLFLECEKWKT